MKLRHLIHLMVILASLLLIISNTSAQFSVYIWINVTDNAGSPTYNMVFGNHERATWGMGGQHDSLSPTVAECESPPLPLDKLGVVWRPARSGVNWGIGFRKYDIKDMDFRDSHRKDTFKLYFSNPLYDTADIILSWPIAESLNVLCDSLKIRIGNEIIDMFSQSGVTIHEAQKDSITYVYIYKYGIPEFIIIDVMKTPTLANHITLGQNYPNPFNPSTQITYSVPKATEVTLKIYDVLGREIAVLVNERKQAGDYKVTWNAEGIPSGVYFYSIVAGEFMQTKKTVLIR